MSLLPAVMGIYRRLGVAIHTSQGDLTTRGSNRRSAMVLASLGRLDVEFGPQIERVVSLEIGSICAAEGSRTHVVDESRGADREKQCGGLVVVVFLDIASQNVDEWVRDTG